jgi:hypothetical protein
VAESRLHVSRREAGLRVRLCLAPTGARALRRYFRQFCDVAAKAASATRDTAQSRYFAGVACQESGGIGQNGQDLCGILKAVVGETERAQRGGLECKCLGYGRGRALLL